MRINQSRSGKCSATEFFNSFPSLHFRLYSITMKPYSPTKSLVPPTTLLRVLESCGRNKRFSGRIIGTHSTTSITGNRPISDNSLSDQNIITRIDITVAVSQKQVLHCVRQLNILIINLIITMK